MRVQETEQQFAKQIEGHRGILFKVCNLYGTSHEDREDVLRRGRLQFPHTDVSFRQYAGWACLHPTAAVRNEAGVYEEPRPAPFPNHVVKARPEDGTTLSASRVGFVYFMLAKHTAGRRRRVAGWR
jgi:hypothetical protein